MDSPRSLRILVADDNRTTAFTLGKVLEKRGYTVEVVLNGLAALDVVRQFKPQAVLIDLEMPGINGHELTRRIRRDPTLALVVVVVVSGYSGDAEMAASLAAGADHHLGKPIDFDTLWTILDGLPPAESGSTDEAAGS